MARCIIGIGGPRSVEYPFLRAHIGRSFVEHVADTQDFRSWRSVSSALADISEHSSGIVLCRLWPVGGHGGTVAESNAVRQCLQYLGVQSAKCIVIAHGVNRKSCGQFNVTEGLARSPLWASGVPRTFLPAHLSSKILSLEIGVGSTRRNEWSPGLKQFNETSMTPKEAAAILQGVFPAAYEWLSKRWFGPFAITEGSAYRRRLPQDTRRGSLALTYEGSLHQKR